MSHHLVERLGVDILKAMAPRPAAKKRAGQAVIIAALGPALPAVFREFDIVAARRIEHFLAQAAHESDGFCTTEEYASGAAYEGRRDLGNVQPGDGRRFKGRGIFQLTGRDNYERYGRLLGLDLIRRPERAAEPVVSLRIAGCYWRERKIGPMADDDDLIRVTRAINGGLNGLADRRRYLSIAKREIAARSAAGVAADARHPGRPVLRRGSEGGVVEMLQALLRKAGFALGLDGDFGAATELAVRTFQRRAGLDDDGVVGPESWSALLGENRS